MLAPAIRAGLIDVWDDTKIGPGANWKSEITTQLASARVAVLLVSQNFLASDFIANHELPPLLEAARKEGVVVFWIYLGHCLYQATEIANFQAAHDIAKPLNLMKKPKREAVLSEVCARLIQVAQTPNSASDAHDSLRSMESPTRMFSARVSHVRFEPTPTGRQDESTKDTLPSLMQLFDDGWKAIIVCGAVCSGKSELVRGFTRARSIFRGHTTLTHKSASPVGGTMPGAVWYQIVKGPDKRVFIDPSGEFFARLSPDRRARLDLPDLTIDYFDFIRRSVQQLAGIVLVVDLTRESYEMSASPWRDQENDFRFLLPAIRWLRFERPERQPEVGITSAISTRAASLPRLDVPVIVLFTKADRLECHVNQIPLDFARRRLPTLHGSLMTHARRYRYDFCYTMVQTESGDQPVDRPCGVFLSLEWLLNPPFRWMPRLLTRGA